MTTPLTKLIEENKWRPIAEAPQSPYDEGKSECFLGKDADGDWHFCYHRKSKYSAFHGIYIVNNGDYTDGGYGNDYKPEVEITHFRPLPDDRLALVAECLDDGYQTIVKHFPEAEVLVNKIRQKATAIAEGADESQIRSDQSNCETI